MTKKIAQLYLMASLYSIWRNPRARNLVNFFLNTDNNMEHIKILV